MSTPQSSASAIQPGAFANAMLEPPSGHKKKRLLQSSISLVVHTGVLALLIILPLLISNGLTIQQLNKTFLVAPPLPAPPPPRPIVTRPQAAAPKYTTSVAKLSVPTTIPKTISMKAPEVAEAPSIQSNAGVVGGMGSVFGGDGTAAPPPPAPVAAPAKKVPVFISGNMKQPVLLFSPTLMYPPIARAARISGTVVILAIIDEHGDVVEARAVSGPPLLVQAALNSVAHRKYQPTILDGQPTPIKLQVQVNFQLAS
ncbi:MAG TPA: energy transducer TonB [Candidatus Aquilonibacter sp.]|nr:energy transducer TonB [Candidatus Aquilonibacter sp.]